MKESRKPLFINNIEKLQYDLQCLIREVIDLKMCCDGSGGSGGTNYKLVSQDSQATGTYTVSAVVGGQTMTTTNFNYTLQGA